MPRRIKQLCVVGTDQSCDVLYALCEDGTLWTATHRPDISWSQLPGVPDPDPEEEPCEPPEPDDNPIPTCPTCGSEMDADDSICSNIHCPTFKG